MDRFTVVEGGAVIMRGKRGVYRQAKVYRRGERVFAGWGTGYLRLSAAGSTGDPDIKWDDIDADGVTVEPGRAPKWRA